MNLNYFVAVPNKPTSMKLKGRNLPELQLDAVQLDQESRIIESRLQQLREVMSREKEEREKSGGFRWKSVKAASHGVAKAKENSFQKLSAGKVKMRVLKGEPEEPGRPAGKAPRPPAGEQAASRKPRLKGKPCGQCEARAARLMCAECGEDYCVGCFARFHQKGALKNHRMIPIQMEIQTSISALDVVSQFKRQIEPEGSAVNSRRKDAKWSQGALKSKPSSTTPPQTPHLLMKNDGVEEEMEEVESQHSQGLLRGVFDEEESGRSFQEALWEWRGRGGVSEPEEERGLEAEPVVKAEPESEADPEDVWGLAETQKVPTEVFTAQADLVQKGRPVEVEFKEHGLSYMEKLLVKKHRRTPIEEYRPLPSLISNQESQMDAGCFTDEEGLTAEEMEMRRYCASLFTPDTAPSTPASTSPSTSTPSSATSSSQQDRPAKSRLSTVELEQMAGDSAVLNSTFTAELETDNGMMAEAEGIPLEPGHQETKRITEPCQPYVPSTPPLKSPTTFNQLPRPPVSTPSPQKRRSRFSPSPQPPLSPNPTPPSPNSSTSRSARAMTTSVETKPALRKTSWSGPCQIGPAQSAVASRQPSPFPRSSRPKSTGSSVPNPLPSRFKLIGSSPPEWTSRAKSTLTSPPAPLSSRCISTGSLPATPLSFRDRSAESPPPDLTSRSNATATPPSTARSSSSISIGSLPPTPLSSRDKSAESPPPDLTSRSKANGTPLSKARTIRSISNGPSQPGYNPFEFPPPELNFGDKYCSSPPLELTSRDKLAASPAPQETFKSKLSVSSPPAPLSSWDKSHHPLEQDFRDESPRSLLSERSLRGKSPGSTLHKHDFSDESHSSPLPEVSFMGESPRLPLPEVSLRGISPGSTLHKHDFSDESHSSPLPEVSFMGESPTLPLPEVSLRGKSPGSTLHKYDFRDDSLSSPLPEVSFRDKSPMSPQPEMSFRHKSPGSNLPEQNFRDESPGLPSPELSFWDKSPGSTRPEQNFRDESPGLPSSELSLGDKSHGSTRPEQDIRNKSPRSPRPELSFRDKSLELVTECQSTESSRSNPMSTKPGSPEPQPSEPPCMSQTEPHTSTETLSFRFPQSASLPEHAQFVPTESPQPPPLLKVASADRLSPILSSAPQSKGESASSSEASSSGLELSPHRGDEDEEMSARAALWALGCGEQSGQSPQAPTVPSALDPDAALGSGLDSELDFGMFDQPVFFPDPSLALHNLASRSLRYTGLDGFLTLGLDPETGSAPPSPRCVGKSLECEDPVERLIGGPECWRPSSSQRDCADEQLVLSIMSSRPINNSLLEATPHRGASPLQRPSLLGSTEARSWSAKNTPRTARPVSADLSARDGPRLGPRPRPKSSPWPKPQSRAAKEILEIACVGRMEREETLLGDEADCLALANLEEEFRLMSRRGTFSSDPGASSAAHTRGGKEAGREGPRSKRRKESGEGHTDDEEDILRDKQNVASLP